MQATNTKPRTHDNAGEIKLESGFTLRFFALPLLFSAVRVVLALLGEDTPRRKYDGDCKSDGTLKEYGDLTKAEHEELGAMWAVDMREE